jgi:hypothetical protein
MTFVMRANGPNHPPGDEAAPRPNFGGEEISRGDRAPVGAKERLPRCRPLWDGQEAVGLEVRDRRATYAMPHVLQRALDPVWPHVGFSSAIRTPRRRISTSTPRQPGRAPYVHFLAMSCRCQRSDVSGVTIVAISRNF